MHVLWYEPSDHFWLPERTLIYNRFVVCVVVDLTGLVNSGCKNLATAADILVENVSVYQLHPLSYQLWSHTNTIHCYQVKHQHIEPEHFHQPFCDNTINRCIYWKLLIKSKPYVYDRPYCCMFKVRGSEAVHHFRYDFITCLKILCLSWRCIFDEVFKNYKVWVQTWP